MSCNCSLSHACCSTCRNQQRVGFFAFTPYPQPTLQGWVCPICKRGNAPTVVSCPCKQEEQEKDLQIFCREQGRKVKSKKKSRA